MIGSSIVAAGVENGDGVSSPPGMNDDAGIRRLHAGRVGQAHPAVRRRRGRRAVGGRQTLDRIDELRWGGCTEHGGFGGTLDELASDRAAAEVAGMARTRLDERGRPSGTSVARRRRRSKPSRPTPRDVASSARRDSCSVPARRARTPATHIQSRDLQSRSEVSPACPVLGVPTSIGSVRRISGLRGSSPNGWSRTRTRPGGSRRTDSSGTSSARPRAVGDDFGSLGSRRYTRAPHDWLAREFVRGTPPGGNGARPRVRTYHMSTSFDEKAYLADPLNDLF